MRPITLDETLKQSILAEIAEKLTTQRNYTDFNFSYTPKSKALENAQKIKVIFTPLAWLKITTLVSMCTTECAWHGLVTTNDARTEFHVTDVLVYPQKITGSTVDIDDVKYETWHQAQSDTVYNSIRLQGHSHVDFGAVPSGTDNTLYKSMLETLQPDSFYLFMILNKKGQFWWNIYDMLNNAIYENSDIITLVTNMSPSGWFNAQQDLFFSKAGYTTLAYNKVTYIAPDPVKNFFPPKRSTEPSRAEPKDPMDTQEEIEDEYEAFSSADHYFGNSYEDVCARAEERASNRKYYKGSKR